jgi:hypothetical protein
MLTAGIAGKGNGDLLRLYARLNLLFNLTGNRPQFLCCNNANVNSNC